MKVMDELVKSDKCPSPAHPCAAVHQEPPGVIVEDLLCELVEVQQRHRLLGGLHVRPGSALQLLYPVRLVYKALSSIKITPNNYGPDWYM